MREEKLLTVREVSSLLGLTEKEVLDLAENGSIPAYKLGGVYLRFKRQQVEEFWKRAKRELQHPPKYSWKEHLVDFFAFNDFYIFSAVIILAMLYIIFR